MSADDLNQAMKGGPTGPGDAMDSVNEKFAQMSNLQNLNSVEGIGAQLQNELQNASQDANVSYGKGMIAQQAGTGVGYGGAGYDESEGLKGGSKKAQKDFPGLAAFARKVYVDGGSTSPRAEALKQAEEEINSDSGAKPPEDKYSNHEDGTWTRFDANGETAAHKNKDGSYEYYAKDSNGHWEVISENDYKKSKSAADSSHGIKGDYTEENYVDPHAEKVRQTMDEMSKNLGLPGIWDLPRSPRIQGDVDPSPEGGVSRADSDLKISQFSKDFLIGQPDPQREGSGGGSPNISGDSPMAGGNIDYGPDSTETGWHGNTRTQDAADFMDQTKKKVETDANAEEDSAAQIDFSDLLKTLPKADLNED